MLYICGVFYIVYISSIIHYVIYYSQYFIIQQENTIFAF